MERTRIVHYTNSRTPVVISPTSPSRPRLSTSSSLSSLASCVDEKAPLASADPDTPRRASKSCERRGSRSSSASRLFDDSKLRTCVYTAVRCQDYPSDRIRLREHKDALGNERPHSASLANGKSPNIDSEENRRHTLGSWSRSRRKSKNESPNSSFSKTESSTLPKRADKDESPSSKTLVKSRRRYTWLSPKPPASPEAARTLPLRERNTNYDENSSPTSSRSSAILPSSLEPNAKTPSPTPADYPRRTASLDSTASGLVGQKAEPASLENNFDSPPTNATLVGSDSPSSTPLADSRPQSDAIHWKNDPRRRPFSHFQDAFDLSPPNSPPQTPSQSDIGTNRPPFHGKGSANSDTGYSSSSTSDTFHYATLPSPHSKAKLSLETRSSSFNTHDLNFRNRTTYSNSPNLSIRNGSPSPNTKAKLSLETRSQSFNTHDLNSRNRTTYRNSPNLSNRNGPNYNNEEYIYEDTTPVNETDDKVYPQWVQASNTRQHHPDSPSSGMRQFHDRETSIPPQGPLKARHPVQRSQSQIINTGNRPLLDPTKFTKNTTNLGQRMQTNSQSSRSDRDRLNSSTSKSQSSEYRSNDVATVDRSFMSPRTRNSFRMAMGNVDTWCDINLSTDSVNRFSSNSSEKTINDFPKHGNVSPKGESNWRDNSLEDDIFVNWDGPIPSEGVGYDDRSNNTLTKRDSRDPGTESDGIKTGVDEDQDTLKQYYDVDMSKDDSLTRRIKRNSMRLATASLTDLTCAVDDIDIGEGTPSNRDSNEKTLVEDVHSYNVTPPLAPRKTHLSRTGSLLSSLDGSSVGSYYSCQSTGGDSDSPFSNARLRDELRARLDSPGMQRINKNFSNSVASEPVSGDSTFPRVSSSRRSTPTSTPSMGRSSHRNRPVYYWTRQSPYPRLLTPSSSASSSKASSERCPSSPQPSISSSIHSNPTSNSHNRRNTAPPRKEKEHSENLKSMLKFSNDYNQEPRLVFRREDPSHRQDPAPPLGVSSRPKTLPIPLSRYSPSPSYTDQFENFTAYASDLTPTSLADSPNSDAVMSPPSLGRPRRKQYAGFDCQPLPMDSFMSDSSSVYTGVSCSSRATDMTGQPDNASQFDESFMSEDVRSNYEVDDSRGDISFEAASGSFKSPYEIHDVSQDVEESESKHGSVHSSSTTKLGNGMDSSMDNIDNDNTSHHETSFDDFIENSSHQDCISPNNKYSQFGKKHFGPEYDAIFRLYKSDDLIGQHDLYNPPSYPMWLQTGKALSSSCLLRTKLYSKHKFMSTRDIFDLMRSPNTKTPLDGTVSLTSLEQHAHRVCEAILRCDEINKETHSLV